MLSDGVLHASGGEGTAARLLFESPASTSGDQLRRSRRFGSLGGPKKTFGVGLLQIHNLHEKCFQMVYCTHQEVKGRPRGCCLNSPASTSGATSCCGAPNAVGLLGGPKGACAVSQVFHPTVLRGRVVTCAVLPRSRPVPW